jgi:hypothetical protein
MYAGSIKETTLTRKTKALVIAVLLAAHSGVAMGESPPVTILTIDVENFVEYRQDVSDPAKFASNPNITTATTPLNFFTATMFADIVAVNGQPVKGLYVGRPRAIASTQTPAPGQAVVDVTHNSFRDLFFEILKSDGTPIGSIAATGLAGGNAPPGAPSVLQGSNWAIIGGTGAFLGARGQAGSGTGNSPRAASMSEAPSERRINGGGKARFILQVIPMEVPQIVVTPNGPAVVHSSDFSLVTPSTSERSGAKRRFARTCSGRLVELPRPLQQRSHDHGAVIERQRWQFMVWRAA